MQQYTLPLQKINNYHVDDFIFSMCNQSLKDLLDNRAVRWGYDPYPEIVLLTSPVDSGKTHFAHVARNLMSELLILEDIDIGKDEEEILHSFNLCHENHQRALFTCKEYEHFNLPDLKSRLASVKVLHIDSPDDLMMRLLLMKSLTERSIKVSEDVVKFLLVRIPRSFVSIARGVDLIDRLSIEQKRNISIHFLSSINFDSV